MEPYFSEEDIEKIKKSQRQPAARSLPQPAITYNIAHNNIDITKIDPEVALKFAKKMKNIFDKKRCSNEKILCFGFSFFGR